MRSAKNVYRRFIEFEEQAASIYMIMASHFCPQNPTLGSLWLDMGIQEKQHAGLLQFCLAEGLLNARLPSEAEIRKIRGLFSSLKKRAADPELAVPDAFLIAAELETSEVNTIYSRLTTPLHDSMYLLRRKIVASLPSHVERLLAEARNVDVPPRTLKKLERLTTNCPD